MFFWILLLAHVIGDFPLQTDVIYRLKRASFWGVLPHVALCTLMNVLVLIPFLSDARAWAAVAFLMVFHFVLDKSKIALSDQLDGDNFLNFTLDQALHIFSIWLAATWLEASLDYGDFAVPRFLADREFVISLAALIFAAFGGTPIIYYAQNYWLKKRSRSHDPVPYPSFPKRVPGLFERFLATLGIIWGGWWLSLTFVAFLPRQIMGREARDRSLVHVSGTVGLLLSLICGFFVLWIGSKGI